MPRAIDGRKECSKCREVKLATKENFSAARKEIDGLATKCKACEKNYRLTNREVILAQKKEYHTANREAVLAQQKEYYSANRKAILAQKKEYHTANREVILTRQKEYRNANREAILTQQKEHHEYIVGPRLDEFRARLVYVMD